MITIEGLTFQYKNSNRNAVEDVHLSIRGGDFLGIIGESGAGKTTLIRAINGIIPIIYPVIIMVVYKLTGRTPLMSHQARFL